MAPRVLAIAMPHIIFERSFVLAWFVRPSQNAFSFLFTVYPLTDISDSFWPIVCSLSIDLIITEFAFVNTTVRKHHLTHAFFETILKLAFVARIVREMFHSTTVWHMILPIPFVAGTIWFSATSLPFQVIVNPNALVHCLIWWCKFSTAVCHSVLPLTNVVRLVWENAQPITISLLILPRAYVHCTRL